jgi:hypothetical protein
VVILSATDPDSQQIKPRQAFGVCLKRRLRKPSLVRDICGNRLRLSDGDVGSGRNRNGTMRGLFFFLEFFHLRVQ